LLFKLPIIQKVPEGQMQMAALIQSHIYQHVDFSAREMAQQDPEIMQMQQQIQQMQQQSQMDPMMMQQMQQQVQQMQQQMQTIMEDKVAQKTVELLQKVESDLQIGQEEDPLVGLRKEELELKDKDIDRKAQEAQQRIKLEGDRIDNNVELGQDRLALQDHTAHLKDDVAKERIDLQRSAQMAKTAENMAKNFFNN